MYEQTFDFDKNNKNLIYNLMVLKGEALIKGHFLAMKQGITAGDEYSNFFTAIANQIDTLLIYFINDEITASLHDRGLLSKLLDELINENYKEEDYKRLEFAKNDLSDLFANRTDFMIGSNFLDFKVNTFSVFECYIDKLYEELILVTPRSNKKEQDLVKLIEKYNNENDPDKRLSIINKIKNISFYVSSSEKIDIVLSKCEDLESKDREFITYYRSQRNTVHNLGVHKGKSQSVTVEGIEIKLEKDMPSFTSNRNSAIFACRKLMDIYESALASVTGLIVF
jgi:hypothetical protein